MTALAVELTAAQLAAHATFGEGERAGMVIRRELRIAETTIEHELWTHGAVGASVLIRPSARLGLYYVKLVTPCRSIELLSEDFDIVVSSLPTRFTLLQLFKALIQCESTLCHGKEL